MMDDGDEVRLLPISQAESGLHPGEPDVVPHIDGYEIAGVLGQGGMGTVWRAVQLSTRREVALKLRGKGAFGSEKARARFEREVELTARLQHPNIARVYDSGLHQGVHYYAMELIEGVPLDKYVEEHAINQRQILELMRTVCEAVQHAHQRGVIHRDLKPSNILVTSDGQPHVLDFGLAKDLLGKGSRRSVSGEGMAAGTPAYMSPEQAAGRTDQIDTRSDVYSLGAILFQLLTKELPHGAADTPYEVLRHVAEREVRRPRDVTKDVDRELEALLLKALARDPNDRYASVAALGQDIENYLAGEPLNARRPSTAYFLRKRIRKYRVPVIAACAVLVLLAGMAAFAYIRIGRERGRAVASERTARSRLTEVERAHERLQKETGRTKAAYEFLRDIFTSDSPAQTIGRHITLREALDQATENLEAKYAGQPEVEADIRDSLAAWYSAVNLHAAAETQLRRVFQIRRETLGEEHPLTLGTMNALGRVLLRTDKLEEAKTLLARSLTLHLDIFGERHLGTLRAMYWFAVALLRQQKSHEAEVWARRNYDIERRLHGEEHPRCLWPLVVLAYSLDNQGEPEEAEALFRKGLESFRNIGKTDTKVPNMALSMARFVEKQNRIDEAAALRRENLDMQCRLHGEEHRKALVAMNALALWFLKMGRLEEAQAVNRRNYDIRQRVQGEEHPETLWALSNLEQMSSSQGKAGAGDVGEPVEGNALAHDAFNDTLTLDWKVIRPDPSHASLAGHPGTLTIITQEGSFVRSDADYENLFLVDCPASASEDFQLITCLSSFEPRGDWNQAGLICYDDDDNYLFFCVERRNQTGRRIFTVGVETDGRFLHLSFSDPDDSKEVWLRIKKRGNLFTLYTSSDGETFSHRTDAFNDGTGLFQGHVMWGDGSVRRVGIFAQNGSGTQAPKIDASFDFFEVRSLSGDSSQALEITSIGAEEQH